MIVNDERLSCDYSSVKGTARCVKVCIVPGSVLCLSVEHSNRMVSV